LSGIGRQRADASAETPQGGTMLRGRIACFLGLMFIGLASIAPSAQPVEQEDACLDDQSTYAAMQTQIDKEQAELRKLEQERAPKEALDARRVRIGELVFLQDCLRADFLDDPVRGPAAKPEWVTLTAYYATNRQQGSSTDGLLSCTGKQNAGGITFGKTVISIPTHRARGDLNLPLNLWLFELPANPSKHFIIKSVAALQRQTALIEMRNRISTTYRKSLLIFVHGYNVPFNDAALRTAQLAHDLNFPGMANACECHLSQIVTACNQQPDCQSSAKNPFRCNVGQRDHGL
jgi:Alpha/beta hydrolase of unknown function (DUF900)